MTNKLAQVTNPGIGELGTEFSGEGSGSSFLSALINVGVTILLIGGSLYFIFMLLTGGVDWIRAGSDKASLEAARGKLANAVLGLLVLFSAWAIFNLIESVFGVDLLNLTIPTLPGAGS